MFGNTKKNKLTSITNLSGHNKLSTTYRAVLTIAPMTAPTLQRSRELVKPWSNIANFRSDDAKRTMSRLREEHLDPRRWYRPCSMLESRDPEKACTSKNCLARMMSNTDARVAARLR